MLNKKEVADTLAKSLITGESIASIILKAQMLASLLEFPIRVYDGPYHSVIKAWQTFPIQAAKEIVEKNPNFSTSYSSWISR